MIGTDVAFAKSAQIYGEGEPSIYFYKITVGLARCYRMTPDGRRQIVAFYVPGDLFGFEAGDRAYFISRGHNGLPCLPHQANFRHQC